MIIANVLGIKCVGTEGYNMKEKFIKKFMLLAKSIADDNNICYSRQIGVVIVDPRTNGVVSVGYNGPPEGTPHTDDINYIINFLWPQLTAVEKFSLISNYWNDLNMKDKAEFQKILPTDNKSTHQKLDSYLPFVASKMENCRQCPRKILGCKAGERRELCSCDGGHAERNALNKLPISSYGLIMFCWCCVPCISCTGAIINSNISEVHCLKEPDYHSVSRYLFSTSKTSLFEYDKTIFLFS